MDYPQDTRHWRRNPREAIDSVAQYERERARLEIGGAVDTVPVAGGQDLGVQAGHDAVGAVMRRPWPQGHLERAIGSCSALG
jgi:hypothetical protein